MMRILVVGAGAFGGWTALHLLRRGARVTLADAYGPGNSRSSSGDETRILRCAYVDAIYAEMTKRALEIWRESERSWGERLFFPTGVIRLQGKNDAEGQAFAKTLVQAQVEHRLLAPADASSRFPQFDFQGIEWVLEEPGAGMLRARRGCDAVVRAFIAEGGTFERRLVRPDEKLDYDAVVWACGPWLNKLFGVPIQSTRQEVAYLGTPAGDASFDEAKMPCWIDDSAAGTDRAYYYGTPGNDWRGMKIGDNAYGEDFDPDSGSRFVRPETLAGIFEYAAMRFPKLAGAPAVETRVCQYELTPDRHLILDRHPSDSRFWIAGGGSGHGYKLGPAVGEMLAAMVLGERAVEPMFRLNRFK
ncbi:MAG: FAD-dependent oxidoreductase [Bryobacteraceae bacterium]|nr:FAD-dependent oxidoreductase [Bryobacteraceae bacterium]